MLVGMASPGQITQNSKFAKSVQYLKKEVRNNGFFAQMSITVGYKSILKCFDWCSEACPKYPGELAISFWHHKKEVRSEVMDLPALAGSSTTPTIYCASNVLPPLILFLSQYGIHTRSFLHLIICLCNISLSCFHITIGPCELACFWTIWPGIISPMHNDFSLHDKYH